MPESPPTRVKEIRPFTDFLVEHRNGVLALELAEAINKVVGAVETTGKAGSFTLKVEIKQPKDTQGAVLVKDTLTVKLPEAHPEVFFFVDGDSNLTRQNERQLGYSGPLLEVPERSAAAPLKEV